MREWTDPRDGKKWLVDAYWTGQVAMAVDRIPRHRGPPEPSEPIIKFIHPPDLQTMRDVYRAPNPTARYPDEFSDQELMDLLDDALASR